MKDDAEKAGAATIGTAAALTAAVASACCVGPALGPLFLAVFGASGLAAVAGLRPYAPVLFVVSGAMLGFAIYRVCVRRPSCSTTAKAPRPYAQAAQRAIKVLILAAICIWIASFSYSVYGFFHE